MKEEEDRGDDRTQECLICGKLFPRGPNDLARHAAAVTLKHVYSEKRSSHFSIGCRKCNTFFTSKDHLELHAKKSKCNPVVVRERIEEASRVEKENAILLNKKKEDMENNVKPDYEEGEEEITEPKKDRISREAAMIATGKIAKLSQSIFSSSTGQLIPAEKIKSQSGQISIKPNGISLGQPIPNLKLSGSSSGQGQGPISSVKSSSSSSSAITGGGTGGGVFIDRTVECLVCGKLFPRGELDLARHSAAVTLQHGVSKIKKAGFLFYCAKCKTYFSSAIHLHSHSIQSSCCTSRVKVMVAPIPTSKTEVAGAMPRKTIYVNSSSLSAARAAIANAKSRTEPRAREDGVKKNDVPGTIKTSPKSEVKETQQVKASRKRDREHSTAVKVEESGNRRKEMKRTKVMVPQDRKAFYAIATLLIDPDLVPADGEKLQQSNFEQYIPEDKQVLLGRLKEILLYDC